MRLDSIIRIIDNKEYEKVTVYRMPVFERFDVSLYNGDLIRIEKISIYGAMPKWIKYRLSYFTFELDDTIDHWEGEYGTNVYCILSNIYNEISKEFEVEN